MAEPSAVIISGNRKKRFTATFTISQDIRASHFVVSTSSSGTLTVADKEGTVINAMPVIAGSCYPLDMPLEGTVTVTVGGTLDAVLVYTPGL